MTFRIATAALIGALLATSALAEVAVSQKDSKWYTDAQARIDELAAVTNNTNRAKNVILFVADGNGVGSNYATRLWVGQKKGGLGDDYVLPQEMFPNLALVKTYTTNDGKRNLATTAGEHVILTHSNPAYTAKTRYEMPDEIPMVWSELAKYLYPTEPQTTTKKTTKEN